MQLFGRRTPSTDATVASTPGDGTDHTSGKGRPTPSRREAQAARKQRLTVPKDPKLARKAVRERDRAERERARVGMAAGDERYLPARDRGAAKAFTRDFVDSRFTAAEFFIFVAIGVIAAGFIRNPSVSNWVTLAFFAFAAVIIVDTILLVVQLQSRARKAFPDPKDRSGIALYAILRSLQLRRFRVPKPRVRRGGQPVLPKS